jgi:hypothetical protein
MMVRRRHRRRARAAVTIQRVARRLHRVGILQELVYTMLEVAHDAATIIQCWLRRAAAQRLLAELKQDYFRAHYGHDFLLSETANWEAFGLSLPQEESSLAEDLYRSPLLSVALQFSPEAEEQGLVKLACAFGPPPAAAVLGLLDYPPPPPGCLFSTPLPPWQVPAESTTQLSTTLLVSTRIPDDVYADTSTAGKKDDLFASLIDLPCVSYEGSVRARMVRETLHAQSASLVVPVRAEAPGAGGEEGSDDCAASQPPQAEPPVLQAPSGPSAQETSTFRRECLGDLTNAGIAEGAVDVSAAQWLGCAAPSAQDVRSAQALALENCAPIYRLLLANL